MMNDPVSNEVRSLFFIPEANFPKFQQKIEKLSRRALKIAGHAVTPVVVDHEYRDSKAGKFKVLHVFFDCDVPKIDGYTFIARLDHSNETGNIIRAVPNTGVNIPEAFRTAAPNCDHCSLRRQRRDTFLVCEDATGAFKQVGSNCLVDFFGHDPAKVAKLAEMLGYAVEVARGAEEYDADSGLRDRRYVDLEDYLGHAAWAIRTKGWISSRTARNTDDPHVISTRMEAYINMFPAQGERAAEVTEADREIAAAALDWTRGFCQNDDLNDYMHNLCVIAGSEVIEERSCGLAASMVFAYLRDQEKLTRKAVDLGDMSGILALFDKNKSARAAFVLLTKNGDEDVQIRLSRAGAGAKVPGSINVTDLGGYGDNRWFGRITLDGQFHNSGRHVLPTGLEATLHAFACDPVGVATAFGKATGRCTVCNKPLEDGRSTEVGYGPVCAKKMGWPWGPTNPDGSKPRRARKAKADVAAPVDAPVAEDIGNIEEERMVAAEIAASETQEDTMVPASNASGVDPVGTTATAAPAEKQEIASPVRQGSIDPETVRSTVAMFLDNPEAVLARPVDNSDLTDGQTYMLTLLADCGSIYGIDAHPDFRALERRGLAVSDGLVDAISSPGCAITNEGLKLLGRYEAPIVLDETERAMLVNFDTMERLDAPLPAVNWRAIDVVAALEKHQFVTLTDDGVSGLRQTVAVTEAGRRYLLGAH